MAWRGLWQRRGERRWPARAIAAPHNAPMQDEPDHLLMALIDRVAAREEAALKALYDQTSGKLYGLALRVTANREWAEDALQEAFLQVWKNAAD